MALLVDWGDPGEVHDVLGILGVSRSCCPDCSACSGVLVEGRVNEEDDVLVVNGQVREQQRVRHVRTR